MPGPEGPGPRPVRWRPPHPRGEAGPRVRGQSLRGPGPAPGEGGAAAHRPRIPPALATRFFATTFGEHPCFGGCFYQETKSVVRGGGAEALGRRGAGERHRDGTICPMGNSCKPQVSCRQKACPTRVVAGAEEVRKVATESEKATQTSTRARARRARPATRQVATSPPPGGSRTQGPGAKPPGPGPGTGGRGGRRPPAQDSTGLGHPLLRNYVRRTPMLRRMFLPGD